VSELVTPDDFNSVPSRAAQSQWKLPFSTIGLALADAPEEVDWHVPGFVAASVVTLLAGRPKVGKSTLAFAMLRALSDGQPFLGSATTKARALLLTEEREPTLREKQHLFGLDDGDLHVLMRHQATGTPWADIVAQAVAYCEQLGLAILIVDTLDKWADLGPDSENSTGDTIRNVRPLLDAAAHGLAVLIVTHQRKAGGKHGEAVRGSNALTGAVDVIVEMEWADGALGDDCARVLRGTSRFATTPELLALSWDAATASFASGDYDEVEQLAEIDRVAAALTHEPQNRDALHDALGGMRRERLTAHLAALVERGRAIRHGAGKKGDPYRWRLEETVEPRSEPADAHRDADSVPARGNGISASARPTEASVPEAPSLGASGGNRIHQGPPNDALHLCACGVVKVQYCRCSNGGEQAP
jgi:hypothetical protein